jgi:hypothetical protein
VDLACSRHGVADPDTGRLGTRPQLEVLGPVVVPDAVAVMDELAVDEMAAQRRVDVPVPAP